MLTAIFRFATPPIRRHATDAIAARAPATPSRSPPLPALFCCRAIDFHVFDTLIVCRRRLRHTLMRAARRVRGMMRGLQR